MPRPYHTIQIKNETNEITHDKKLANSNHEKPCLANIRQIQILSIFCFDYGLKTKLIFRYYKLKS